MGAFFFNRDYALEKSASFMRLFGNLHIATPL